MELDLLKVYKFDDKIRLGDMNDGGYVIAELKCNYDCYISCGVADEESFSRDFITRYNPKINYAFDGTISRYPYRYTKNIQFIRKNIDSFNSETSTNLYDFLENKSSVFLKMDIEGGEYSWLSSISLDYLSKIKQIVIEFHGIMDDSYGTSLSDKIKCLTKLSTTHYLVHAHGNNWGTTINNIPVVIELTYVNKNYFQTIPEANKTALPVANLDYPNKNIVPDFNLNFYPFVSSE